MSRACATDDPEGCGWFERGHALGLAGAGAAERARATHRASERQRMLFDLGFQAGEFDASSPDYTAAADSARRAAIEAEEPSCPKTNWVA